MNLFGLATTCESKLLEREKRQVCTVLLGILCVEGSPFVWITRGRAVKGQRAVRVDAGT